MNHKSRAPSAEVVEIVQAAVPGALVGRFIDRPLPGMAGNSFEIVGWVIPKTASVESVQVLADGVPVGETELNHVRSDVGEAFPDIPDAGQFGFWTTVELNHPPFNQELAIRVELSDGSRIPLGSIRLRLVSDRGEKPDEYRRHREAGGSGRSIAPGRRTWWRRNRSEV